MTPTSGGETTVEPTGVDETIGRMESLYRAVTGRDAPAAETVYAPIPVERDPAEYVEEQMSRLLDLLDQPQQAERREPTWAPPLSVCDVGPEIVVRIDLPGLTREEVEVTAVGNVLGVTGRRAAPSPSEGTMRLSECHYGPFRRTLVLQGALPGAEPSARMKDGILEIRITRASSQPVPTRTVPVN